MNGEKGRKYKSLSPLGEIMVPQHVENVPIRINPDLREKVVVIIILNTTAWVRKSGMHIFHGDLQARLEQLRTESPPPSRLESILPVSKSLSPSSDH